MSRKLILILGFVLAATVVLLADGAFVDDETETANGADPRQLTATVSAANAIVWCGMTQDHNTAVDLSFGNSDAEEGDTTSVFSTALSMWCWVVPNTGGGSVVGTFDAADNSSWDFLLAIELSGIATSSPIEDSDEMPVADSGVTSHTSPSVTTAGAGFIVCVTGSNRDLTFTGTGDESAQIGTTGGLGVNFMYVTRRVASGGSYNCTYDLSSSGIVWTNIYALLESAGGGGGGGANPATVRPRGGGGDIIANMRPHRPARVVTVQTVRR